MEIVGTIWNEGIIRPMINSLVLLYWLFFSNFGLSIIFFTIIVRTAMIPLSMKQSRQMKAMTGIQPKVREIQKKYPNDRAKASQETMRLYREQGVNPLGCLGPMIIQMPIFFGLFFALRQTLPSTPEKLASLSGRLYGWLPNVNEAVPLDSSFLWMDLAKFSANNPVPFLLPILVGGSMWMMQKITTMPAATAQQESTNRMMLWMMPLMFGYFTLYFESGLALYWIMSNIIGIVIQGFVTGWGPLANLVPSQFKKAQEPAPALAAPTKEAPIDGDDRDDGQDNRGSNRNRPKRARRRTGGRRNRRR